MPPPSSTNSASSSTPLRPRPDRIKDSILKESSNGWASASSTTPLRIAKRDTLSPSSSSSPNPSSNANANSNASGGTRVVARRSSNSYKHMFNNNLVSRSPFKSQLVPRQPHPPTSRLGLGLGLGHAAPTPRKASGEKRPRPVSLIQQAEHENAARVSELGFKRRQSKGFQGLVEKGPVSKSPFRNFMSPGKSDEHDHDQEYSDDEDMDGDRDMGVDGDMDMDMGAPIAIAFPTKGDDTTSPETTETESSLASRETRESRESIGRPRTPPIRPTPPTITPSPSFERRSPGPSALQGSPARSSLAKQKSRLLGPRSRSLSTGASTSPVEVAPPPRRERRKTVTFDERCDVVEFDRESCEDAVFDTDDEDVYGAPEPHLRSQQSRSSQQGTNISNSQEPSFEGLDYSALDDSINGLVDSMLHEAETANSSLSTPSTPEAHSASLSDIVTDIDMMPGGAEGGVPLGRTHHAERAREAHDSDMGINTPPRLPAAFSIEELSFSTPPRPAHAFPADPHTPPGHGTPTFSNNNNSYGTAALPSLPPDTERVEDGMPLGRSHHADRARAAHERGEDSDVKMLPPSPSPRPGPSLVKGASGELEDGLMPKFDLGFGLEELGAGMDMDMDQERRDENEDVFGTPRDSRPEYQFDSEHPSIDEDLLSNLSVSVASFREFPPQMGVDYEPDDANESSHQLDRSFGARSDRSLDAIVSNLRLREERIDEGLLQSTSEEMERERERTDTDGTVTEAQTPGFREVEAENEHELPSPPRMPHALYAQTDTGSSNSLAGSEGRRSRSGSPRITKEDVMRRLQRQRSAENQSPLAMSASTETMPKIGEGEEAWMEVPVDEREREMEMEMEMEMELPPTPSQMQMDKPQPRPSLEERLKRALSPALVTPSPMRPAVVPSTSPAPPSPAAVLPQSTISPPPRPHSQDPSHPHFSPREPERNTPPLSSPPHVGRHGRSYTYDFDERPPSAPAKIAPASTQRSRSPMAPSFDFGQPGVDIAEMDMRSALERLVDDVSIAGGGTVAGSIRSRLSGNLDMGIGMGEIEMNNSGATQSDGDVSMVETVETADTENTELLAYLRDDGGERPQLQRAGTAPLPALPATSTPDRQPQSRSVSGVSMVGGCEGEDLTPLIPGSAPPEFNSIPISAPAPLRPTHRDQVGLGLGVGPSSNRLPQAPPLPPKTPEKSARQVREEMIREKRRQARARESGEYFVPPRRDAAGNLLEESPASRRKSGEVRPRLSAGRSMSTGDAEDLLSAEVPAAAQRRVSALRNRRGGVLGMTLDDEDMLADSIERELKKMDDPKKKSKSYELRERDAVVYASSSQEDSFAPMDQSLEEEDKAWRTVRRPSDMNEYAREIKEIRAQEKPGKSHGKVFVKVMRIKGINVPLPQQNTVFTCTLNNGIHFVTTPECRLTRDARIEQEFELIEHTKLEFTLTLKVRRDPHILQQFKAITPPALPTPPQAAPVVPTHHRGVRSFFGGAPKKNKPPKHIRSQTEPIVRFVMEDNLARYMKQDGTLARAFIAFKDIARHCDTRLFETTFPLIGQRLEAPGEGGGKGGEMVAKQVGEIVLQVFRLPPLPGIPQSQLPQSLDECHRGLRHISWHKVTYHEGILTQLGGDCSTWRRRQLRVIGGSLVAFNDVTKRATATIDLKKAIAIEDDQDPKTASKQRDVDDFDAMYGVERSFRLVFPHHQEITFFADTDEEKMRWLEVFRALVGHIPPHPLWAELLWQKLNEAKTTTKPTITSSASSNPNGK